MIINSLTNLHCYEKQFPFLTDISSFIKANDLSKIKDSRIDVSDRLFVVFINEIQSVEQNNIILEAHRNWIDIHCTILGKDRIIFKEIEACKNIEKEYDPTDDYILYRELPSGAVSIEEGYFCLIEPNMAHMALCGEGSISKIVFKAKCN